jgi:ABC-type nitrate/sulfonate/bicarbonate transport system ATPase subunit
MTVVPARENHRRPAPTAQAQPDALRLISLEGVTFGYTHPLLQGFDWHIGAGESWSILGQSGSGKTTLLYLIAGLRQPQAGQVCFRGQPLAGPNHDVGLMLQDYGLLPWMTARQNVELGLKIRRVSRTQRRQVVSDWLARMEISHVADQFPAQLSGGQRQRVALARVLALGTNVLLLDEPLSAVDELTRERLQKTLWQIKRELGVTMIMVTHSVEEAALLTSNILIVPDDPPMTQPQVLRRPCNQVMPSREDPAFQHFCSQIRGALKL